MHKCLTSSRDKICLKIFGGPDLGQRGQNHARGFLLFFAMFALLICPEIGYSDSLQQCMTSRGKTRGKTHEKKLLGPNFDQNLGQNQAQN